MGKRSWSGLTFQIIIRISFQQFPKDIIPVLWEYSDNPASMTKWLTPVKKEKLPFFVQSAVDSWGNVYPAADYTYDNIDICLKTCRDEKAIGYITSVWTDAVQPLLRNTWLFMAYGSAGAWQNEPPGQENLSEQLLPDHVSGIFRTNERCIYKDVRIGRFAWQNVLADIPFRRCGKILFLLTILKIPHCILMISKMQGLRPKQLRRNLSEALQCRSRRYRIYQDHAGKLPAAGLHRNKVHLGKNNC